MSRPTNSVSDGKLGNSFNSSTVRTNNTSSIVVQPAKAQVTAGVGLDNAARIHNEALDITQGRHRNFMVKSALALWVSHWPFMLIFIIYMIKQKAANQFLYSFYQGEPRTRWAYAITCTVLLLLTIIVPSVYPPAGRKGIGIPLYILYILTLSYITGFAFTTQSQGFYGKNLDSSMLPISMGLFYASFGVLITAAMSVRKVPKVVAVGVAVAGVFMSQLLLALYAEITNPQLWAWGLFLMFGAVMGFFYAFDLEDMVRKRGTYYKTNDWFLGFIHLQTDLFFRLPRDLIFRRNQQSEVVQELEVAEPDVVLQ